MNADRTATHCRYINKPFASTLLSVHVDASTSPDDMQPSDIFDTMTMSSASHLVRNEIPFAVPQFTLSKDMPSVHNDDAVHSSRAPISSEASGGRVKEVVVGITDFGRLSDAADLLHRGCGQMQPANVWQCPQRGTAVRLLPSSTSSVIFQVGVYGRRHVV